MSHFVTGVSEKLQEECRSAMLHDSMNILGLMVHSRSVEEERAKQKSRDVKRGRSYDGGFQRMILKYKTSLDLRNGFLIKSL